MTTVGDHIKFQSDTGRYHEGRIVHVVSGDTVHLVALSDGSNWPTGDAATVASKAFFNVDKGTSAGEWQPSTAFAGELAALDDDSALATTAAVNTAIAGCSATPSGGSHPSLTIGTPRQPSTTRPTRVTVSGTWTASLNVTGSVSGTIELRSDSNSTPTTVQLDAQPGFSATLLVGVAVGQTIPWSLSYDVLAGHYYVLAASGSGTFTITRATEQVL